MSKLIISVRNSAEAQLAHAYGADVIDVKEPLNGPLGQPDATTLLNVMSALPPAATISVACGELADARRLCPRDSMRVRFAKAGCAGLPTTRAWCEAFNKFRGQLPDGVEAVAAAYADHAKAASPPMGALLEAAGRLGAKRFLVDTFCKTGGNLFQIVSDRALERLASRARALRIRIALAGSITRKDLHKAGFLRPDYLAMRGGVCERGRSSQISANLIQMVRKEMDEMISASPIPHS